MVQSTHTLVVGGSGMLAGLCKSLAQQGHNIVILCRNEDKLRCNIGPDLDKMAMPIFVDYCDEQATRECLDIHVRAEGPIDATVAWIHPEKSTSAHTLFASYTKKQYFAVLGSSYGKPELIVPVRDQILSGNSTLTIHTISLGYVQRPLIGHRWLTNSEISRGVRKAIELKQDHYIVGHLDDVAHE